MSLLVIPLALLLLLSFLLALAEAHWRFEEEDEDEDAIFAAVISRTLLLSIMTGIVSVWFGIGVGVVATLLVFASQQVLGQRLGSSALAMRNGKSFGRLMKALSPALAWLRIHKPEPTTELELELLESVEDFGDTVVREVMVPRVDLIAVSSELTLEDALSLFVSSGYSRLPVFDGSIDEITGVLYLKDIARVTHQDPARLATETTGANARRAIYVPETKPVADLLREMQQEATQIAIVVDEYGGVAGIATVEDLIEELVGEISDEYDRDAEQIEDLGSGLYRVSPRTNIFELAEFFDVDIVEQDVDTVGGLISKLLGSLPKGGESVEFAGVELTAERVDAKRQRLQSLLARKISNVENA